MFMLNKLFESESESESLERIGISTIHYISDVFRKTVEECCSSAPKTVVA